MSSQVSAPSGHRPACGRFGVALCIIGQVAYRVITVNLVHQPFVEHFCAFVLARRRAAWAFLACWIRRTSSKKSLVKIPWMHNSGPTRRYPKSRAASWIEDSSTRHVAAIFGMLKFIGRGKRFLLHPWHWPFEALPSTGQNCRA